MERRPAAILADGGSLDSTAAIAKAHGPPVRVHTQATVEPAATRKFGRAQAESNLTLPGTLWRGRQRAAMRASATLSISAAKQSILDSTS